MSWDVPTCLDPCGMCPCGRDPARVVPAELVCAHLTQAVIQREDQLPIGSTATAPHGPSCLCPAPLHFSSPRGPFLIWREGQLPLQQTAQSPRKCLLESTEDGLGFQLTSWSQISTNSPWHRGRPVHSCLERQAGRFL